MVARLLKDREEDHPYFHWMNHAEVQRFWREMETHRLNPFIAVQVYDICDDPMFPAAWIAGLVQTLLYADFFYYYFQR